MEERGYFRGFRRQGAALLAALCLIVLAASSAHAARKNLGAFSVDMPAGWSLEEEEESLLTLKAPKGQGSLSVLLLWYDQGIEDRLVWSIARSHGMDSVHALGKGLGFVFGNKGERHWARLAGDCFVHITVENACPGARQVLQSFRPGTEEDAPGMTRAIAELQKPEVLAWLGNGDLAAGASPVAAPPVTPLPVPKPDFAALGGVADKAVPLLQLSAEEIPQGWTQTREGAWTVLTSPDGKHWQGHRNYRLSEGREAPVALARTFGGFNIIFSEGSLYFETPQGYEASMTPSDEGLCALVVQSPDQPEPID